MNEYLLESFLIQYYLLDAVCGSFLTDRAREDMFYELAKLFCLEKTAELEAYYRESHQQHFGQIQDTVAYERLCRTIEFAQKSGQDVDLTERDRIILAQKREAMRIKSHIFKEAKTLTRETVCATLLSTAMNGNVAAMVTLSYMEYNGICACRDRERARKRIRLCARWNSLPGSLMGLAWDEQNRQSYLDTLYTVSRSQEQKQAFACICRYHGCEGQCSQRPVARILEKAFGQGLVSREVYDQSFAEVAFSRLLGTQDKQKLLLNSQKDAIRSLSDIPFGVRWDSQLRFDPDCARQVPLARSAEISKILRNITVAKNCPCQVYAPLLIVSSDDYITQMYSAMLKKGFRESAVIELDAGTLTLQDFAGSIDNVFLRGLSSTQNARTVFMIRDCQELDRQQLQELRKMLDYEYRKQFKLFRPAVSLDLSGVVFVLLASRRNTAVLELAECCDTLWTCQISREEKDLVVDALFRDRCSSFGCEDTSMEEDCKAFLADFDTRQLQQILDSALRWAVFENRQSITLSSIRCICAEQNMTAKRDFGYMGGNCYA